jgi:ribosome-associated translation inhibitor RaiA
MQVQVNTGNGCEGKETLERWANDYLNEALARFKQEITRVEVQLSDENTAKGGAADKRCMMEARLEGHAPIAVTEHAGTVAQAIDGAADRLVHRLEHTLGRRHDQRRRGVPLPVEPD